MVKNQKPSCTSKHDTPFKIEHAIEYGLEITQRDPQTLRVCSVRCQFCSYFGREELLGQKRQRKQTANVKDWRPPFRPEYYREHHETQHEIRWKEYKELSVTEKEKYFKNQTRFKDTVMSHFGYTNTHIIYKIDPAIITKVIGDMFFHPDDYNGTTRAHVLKLFAPN